MVGLIIALRPAVEMLASVPSGVLSDIIGRKLPMTFGLIVTGLILLIFGELRNLIQLAIASAALGFSDALVVTSALALMMDYNSPKERGSVIGIMVAALSAGSFVGFVTAGFLVSKLVQQVVYIIPGLLTVATGVIIGLSDFALFPSSAGKTAPLSRVTTLMRRQAWLLVSMFIVLVLVSTATIFLPLYASKNQLSPATASESYVALVLIAIAAYLAGG